MIEQGFNYTDSTVKEMIDLFETRVENLEPKEKRKKSSAAAKKTKNKKRLKKGKQKNSNSNVLASSKESSMERLVYCILHGKCNHTMDLCSMMRKNKQRKKKNF